jgi:hypothetical protein
MLRSCPPHDRYTPIHVRTTARNSRSGYPIPGRRRPITLKEIEMRTVGRLLPLLLLLVAAFAVSQGARLGEAQSNAEQVNDLTGAWLLTVRIGPPAPPEFRGLATFITDGNFIATAQADGICCPTEGPAHGVWVKTGARNFAVSFATIWHQADGSLFGLLKSNWALTLDHQSDRLTGQIQGQVVDPNGNLIFPIQGTLTGERIRIQ